MRQNVPLKTLPHSLPSSMNWHIQGKDFSTVIFLLNISSLMICGDHWWQTGSVFQKTAFLASVFIGFLFMYNHIISLTLLLKAFPNWMYQFFPVCFLGHKIRCNWPLKWRHDHLHCIHDFFPVQTLRYFLRVYIWQLVVPLWLHSYLWGAHWCLMKSEGS